MKRKTFQRPDIIRTGLVILLLVAFFSGGLIGLRLIPRQTAWITELVIIAMYWHMFHHCRAAGRRITLVGGPFVALMLVVSLLSCLLNALSMISLMLFLRKLLRFYLLMIILINVPLDLTFIRKMHRFIAWLYIIQIPTAVVKLFIYGQGESAIGTYSVDSGGNSTIIPMMAAGFLLPYHYAHHASFLNPVLGISFLLFGIIGGKRGIVILVPLVVAFAACSMQRHLKTRAFRRRTVVLALTVILGSSASFYLVAKAVPSLNPDTKTWGRFSASYAFERISERMETTQKGIATHRGAATKAAMGYLSRKGVTALMLGRGPGSVMKSVFSAYDTRYTNKARELGFRYGKTGFVWLSLQIGLCGAVTWLCFFVYLYFLLSEMTDTETDSYWVAYNLGVINFTFVTLLISCIYNNHLLIDDLSSMIYMLMLAFAIKRYMLRTDTVRVPTLGRLQRQRRSRA